MINLMRNPNLGIMSQTWVPGLNKYTQTNCHVTLTENGVRIYRPPNYTQSANGSTIYGGLKIENSATSTIHEYDPTVDNIFNLEEGHTYVIRMHVAGQSHANFNFFRWSNNMGYEGNSTRGLLPNPTGKIYQNIPVDFQGEMDCFYQFTISDELVKPCLTGYITSYVAGTNYLSYRHFMVGFNYSDTGELGTDLYITNLRMYDITTGENTPLSIKKNGIILSSSIVETINDQASIQNNSELFCNNFYEY